MGWLYRSWSTTVYISIIITVTAFVFIIPVARLLFGTVGFGELDEVIDILFFEEQ